MRIEDLVPVGVDDRADRARPAGREPPGAGVGPIIELARGRQHPLARLGFDFG